MGYRDNCTAAIVIYQIEVELIDHLSVEFGVESSLCQFAVVFVHVH